MGRPKAAIRRSEMVYARLTPKEAAAFKRLVARREEDLKEEGAEMDGPSVIRWLIAREVAARGLDQEPVEEREAPGLQPATAVSPKHTKERKNDDHRTTTAPKTRR